MSFKTLPPGAVIGVIAPAGPTQPDSLAAVPALYERFGYRVRVFPGCRLRTDYLAGDDDARLADIHAALADDELAAIHCMRGGYGAMRLLDRIDTSGYPAYQQAAKQLRVRWLLRRGQVPPERPGGQQGGDACQY